ncbi:AimR family lysis-lysogeny pheromone receptor [Bacillus carboniphilus]|uniref:AimR family lysis-lysogeny pheromone receptor n=1 Tax=Bacillus carboniphilus TaxID=86663 RepID=A0ABY9JWK3_9BACI|nr:AimR family lysis-lysogeny pheromone receptor [Bacillus carboniphilus]WLR42872.1 AimR family lysis-lysogeny pheromone receptor [Bacillus carboniphilus]
MKLEEIKDCILKDSQLKVRSYQDIADEIGVTKNTVANTIKFIDTGQPQTSLDAILGYHKLYAKKDDPEWTTIENYALKDGLKSSHLKDILDYCYENDYFDTMKKVVAIGMEKPHEMSKVTRLYELLMQIRTREITFMEAYAESKAINWGHPHVEILKEYIEIIYLYNSYEYNKTEDRCNSLLGKLKEIDKTELPSPRFIDRVKVYNLNALLKVKKYALVREMGENLLTNAIGDRFRALAHTYIAKSYFYESCDLSELHFNKASEIYEKLGLRSDFIVIQRNIELLKLLYNKLEEEDVTSGFEPHLVNLKSLNFRFEEAEHLLDSIDISNYETYDLLIARGLIEYGLYGKDGYLCLAVKEFEKYGDLHMATLPVKLKEKIESSRKEILT